MLPRFENCVALCLSKKKNEIDINVIRSSEILFPGAPMFESGAHSKILDPSLVKVILVTVLVVCGTYKGIKYSRKTLSNFS